MYYVYRLKSIKHTGETYIGVTSDLQRRLDEHNRGDSFYTARYAPWLVTNYFAFDDKDLASKFEQYLKTSSGRAFGNKHFWQK